MEYLYITGLFESLSGGLVIVFIVFGTFQIVSSAILMLSYVLQSMEKCKLQRDQYVVTEPELEAPNG